MRPTYDGKVALLGGCIDYAGTFPPAALPLEDALKKAATFRQTGKHPWLMGKVAMPLSNLKKLGSRSLYEAGADGSAWLFTVLGGFGKDTPADEFAKTIEWELREIRRCNERGVDSSLRQCAVAYETRVPAELGLKTETDSIRTAISPILDRMATLTRGAITPYFELPWDGDWKHSIPAFATALAGWADENVESGLVPGIKIRTGGVYVPASEQIAAVVAACVSRGLRFKATQGLHHVLTHRDEKGAESHGFLNLFAALALAHGLGTDSFGEREIKRCLSDMERKNFRLDGSGVSWLDYTLDCDGIEAARRQHAACFGSCSLDEPDDFLAEAFPN